MTRHNQEQTPEHLGSALRVAVPPDDAGAETFDRYEWQAMLATVDLLSMYIDALAAGLDPRNIIDCGLVCEYHEDWACVLHGEVELVSGKHKEPAFGAYTTASGLLGDGGISHLFDRWHTLDQASHPLQTFSANPPIEASDTSQRDIFDSDPLDVLRHVLMTSDADRPGYETRLAGKHLGPLADRGPKSRLDMGRTLARGPGV